MFYNDITTLCDVTGIFDAVPVGESITSERDTGSLSMVKCPFIWFLFGQYRSLLWAYIISIFPIILAAVNKIDSYHGQELLVLFGLLESCPGPNDFNYNTLPKDLSWLHKTCEKSEQ